MLGNKVLMTFLYRGVSLELHNKLNGRLIPAGNNIQVVMTRGDYAQGAVMCRDGTFVRSPSESNTVRAHQLVSGIHEGCFVSTTERFEVAVRFATKEGSVDGFVYVLDQEKFRELGIVSYGFADSRYPDEHEVSIRAEDGGEIPQAAIAKIISVSATEYRSNAPSHGAAFGKL